MNHHSTATLLRLELAYTGTKFVDLVLEHTHNLVLALNVRLLLCQLLVHGINPGLEVRCLGSAVGVIHNQKQPFVFVSKLYNYSMPYFVPLQGRDAPQ